MTGNWYIDDTDIYATYNVGLLQSGINDLFLFPAMRHPEQTDWFERDGIDVDLDNPILEARNITIGFASITKSNSDIDNFLSFVAKPDYRTLAITSLGRTWKLRTLSETAREVYKNAQTFSIQFSDDFPRNMLTGDTSLSGHGFNVLDSDYMLDDKLLSDYGIIIEKAKANIYKMPAIKQGLVRNISTLDGLIAYNSLGTFQSKEVTLECALYCDTIERFWSNYISFFGDLVKPDLRTLTLQNNPYSCFYRRTSNPQFYRGRGFVLLKFDLTLVFTDSRPHEIIDVLANEEYRILTSTDGQYAFIVKI